MNVSYDVTGTLRAEMGGHPLGEVCSTISQKYGTGGGNVPIVVELSCGNPWDSQSERVYYGDGAWHSLNANSGGGQNRDAVLAFTQNQRDEVRDLKDVAGSLAAEPGMKQQTYVFENYSMQVVDDGRTDSDGIRTGKRRNNEGGGPCLNASHEQPILMSDRKGHNGITDDGTATTLTAQEKERPIVFDKEMYNCGENCDGSPQAKEDEVAPTVRSDDHPSGVCTSIVRRLTPMECERLQGFPDNWSKYGVSEKGEIYELSDSARYRLQGNSIARPFWTWLLRRIAAQYERPATLGSLFDGQGGFPLCAVEVGMRPIWASEIEKHAIAVTRYQFGDE